MSALTRMNEATFDNLISIKKMNCFNDKDLQVSIQRPNMEFSLVTWFGVTLFKSFKIDECISYSSTTYCAKAYGVCDSERFTR